MRGRILLVAPFATLPGEPGESRFLTLARQMAGQHQVELITSRFCHFTKRHRQGNPQVAGVSVTLLDEPGYGRNIGWARLRSHHILCRQLRAYLAKAAPVDLIYSALPLVQSNLLLARHARQSGAALVIDIQDLWPEAISGPLPWFGGALGQRLLHPLRARRDRACRAADGVVAVSPDYLAMAKRPDLPEDRRLWAYIGSETLWPPRIPPQGARLRAVYVGSFAGSYDLETLVRAAALTPAVEIHLLGTGPHDARLRDLNSHLGGNAIFHGAKPYGEAMAFVRSCDLALNAIQPSSRAGVTNKLSDYLCASLPILSCQSHPQVRALLEAGAGCSYRAGDAQGLADLLEDLARNPASRVRMAQAAHDIAQRHFERARSYAPILRMVGELIAERRAA